MANKTQKAIKRSTGEWLYCSFQAHPEEISKWRELAGADDRSLSWWIRNTLNKAASLADGGKSHEVTESVDVETVSPHRA
jgi:hypothetical protein